MRKLLWIGDAACDSGFARATHYTLDVLRRTWDVHVLGLNYRGDPHPWPYPIYPCWPGGDLFGVGRLNEIVKKVGPDCIVIQNDVWNVPAYMAKIQGIPVVATLAVDGKNCQGRLLNGIKLALFWTKFAQEEAHRGGYTGASAVVPLGVDTTIYHPYDQQEARQYILGAAAMERLGPSGYIVGNINRNQPRKRLDLTIAYFSRWVAQFKVPDAFLFLHVAPTGDAGYDCKQLSAYYGIQNRLILSEPGVFHGATEAQLAMTYSCFDVQFTTTQGEGWGLCTLEGMACGVPQIVPDWAALGEWPGDAAVRVPCTSICVTPNKINAIGGVMDEVAGIEALQSLYNDPDLRKVHKERGMQLVAEERFQWLNIGERFAAELEKGLSVQ